MIPYRDEKIKNAISFFAKKHTTKTRKPLYQTYLYKYLGFLDFYSVRETGRPVLGLAYSALHWGPVPMEIYTTKKDTDKYKFTKDGSNYFIRSTQKPDMKYFSQYEIELMNRLVEIYATTWMRTDIMSDASHEDILAWKRTWKKKPNSIMDYVLEFKGDLFSKNENELTYPESVFLTYKALTS